jgi:hypothetical protein
MYFRQFLMYDFCWSICYLGMLILKSNQSHRLGFQRFGNLIQIRNDHFGIRHAVRYGTAWSPLSRISGPHFGEEKMLSGTDGLRVWKRGPSDPYYSSIWLGCAMVFFLRQVKFALAAVGPRIQVPVSAFFGPEQYCPTLSSWFDSSHDWVVWGPAGLVCP